MAAPEQQTLGEFIRTRREALKLSLRAFADRVGISPAHQSDIEHDRRRPSAGLMTKMAAVFEVDEQELQRHDSRLRAEVRQWVEQYPELSSLLSDVAGSKKSGQPVKELIAAWKRAYMRSRS